MCIIMTESTLPVVYATLGTVYVLGKLFIDFSQNLDV